jgi:hypothetical protein
MSCEQCHELYVERTGRKTPCDTCPKPLLELRNEWLWDVFQTMISQSRASLGGFSGFDYTALVFVLRAKDIPENLWPYVLEKFEILTPIASKHWNKKEEE